jgi:ubiquinone/menaquinone biosynthesis C-methylase UbiE
MDPLGCLLKLIESFVEDVSDLVEKIVVSYSVMKQLDDSQLAAFDGDDVVGDKWDLIFSSINRDFPDGCFKFLDIGGGNGVFSDKILSTYPNATCTVLDNSRLLLGRNSTNPRKKLVYDSVENLGNLAEKYDLIFFNWVLHHLVEESYRKSRVNIERALRNAASLLTERGRISIYENMYNGIVIDGLPSHIVFRLTSLKAVSKLATRMGSNSAGVGVCFLSRKQWVSTFEKTDLQPLSFSNAESPWSIPLKFKIFLHMGKVCKAHFWLVPVG